MMRRILLATTALVGVTFVSADEAEADPISTWVAASVFQLTAGTATFAFVAGTVSLALNIGATLLLRKLAGGGQRPRADQVRAELRRPQSLPSYRFVYGRTWAPGTPCIYKVVGETLFLCYLLNSRPSEMGSNYKLILDKREVEFSGNPFNHSGDGAVGTNYPFTGHLEFWLAAGFQTIAPTKIVAEAENQILSTDAWRGRTVLWMKLESGDNGEFRERWPATPPEVNVEADWSILYDPRTETESFSRNSALAVLDALQNNPIVKYGNEHLRLDLFGEAADVCDELFPVKGGGTIPKFTADGILVFAAGSEVEDQLDPLLDSGAMIFTRIGGRLGVVPAGQRNPVATITEVANTQGMELVRWAPSDSVYSEGEARFPSADRAYEMAPTPLYVATDGQPQDLAWEFNPSAGTCKLWAGNNLIAEGSGTFTEWAGTNNGGYGVSSGSQPSGVPTATWGPNLGQLEVYEGQTLQATQWMAGPYIRTDQMTLSFTYQKGETISTVSDRTTPITFVARGVKFPESPQDQILFELGGSTVGSAVWATSAGEIGVRCGSGGPVPSAPAAYAVVPFVGSKFADAREQDGGVPNRLTIDLDFVSDFRRAEYLLKIFVERSRNQKSVSFEAMPDAFDLVSGSVCTFDLGAPFTTWAGKYVVDSANPSAGVNQDDSISIRMPMSIREERDWVYSWYPDLEEKELATGTLDNYATVQPPETVTGFSGTTAARVSGDETVPTVVVAWDESPSASVSRYIWQWRRSFNGVMEQNWRSGGELNRGASDQNGLYSESVDWVVIGENYQFRVKSEYLAIPTFYSSQWRTSSVVEATGPSQIVTAPSSLSATGVSTSQIDISATQSNDSNARAILIYYNDVDSELTATLLDTKSATANVQVETSHIGLGSGETWYYFARARDQWGNLSDFTPSASATTQ